MRLVVLGGTRFIGRAIVEDLVAAGHRVAVVHRGDTEPDDWVDVDHIHVDRHDLGEHRSEIENFAPDAAIDTIALIRAHAETGHAALPDVPTVVLSSMAVYRAYEGFLAGRNARPVPLTEESEVREHRCPHRGAGRRSCASLWSSVPTTASVARSSSSPGCGPGDR